MALRIRRGTENERQVTALDNGEIAWTSDTQKLYVGLGTGQVGNAGMVNVLASSAGNGLTFNPATQQLDINAVALNLTTTDVGEGINQYFTQERAQDAAASLLTSGIHSGITFTYQNTQDVANRIDASVSLALSSLTDVTISGTPASNAVLKFNGTKWVPSNSFVSGDLSPQLGASLDLNGKDITGTGNISLTGNISNSNVRIANGAIEVNNYFFDIRHQTPTDPVILRRQVPVASSHTAVDAVTIGDYGTGTVTSVSRGTLASKQVVQAGDSLATDAYAAWNGTGYQPTSAVFHRIDPAGTVTGSSVPGCAGFIVWDSSNTADVSKSLMLDSRGYVSIGLLAPAEATLDVNGFAKLAVLTSPPASPSNGMIAIADGTSWDPAGTGKSVMVAYLAGGWRVAATAP